MRLRDLIRLAAVLSIALVTVPVAHAQEADSILGTWSTQTGT